jgi:radical SAM protein with 4Fe4S-binding SPASM domain
MKGKNELVRRNNLMAFGLYKKIIDEVYRHITSLLLYFQGESFLHPHFYEMIRYAVKKKVFTMTSTNGHYLDEENAMNIVRSGLHKIVISMDGVTQDVYEQYRRGGDLKNVIQGIRNLVYWKKKYNSKTPFIVVQFLVFKHNQHQIEDFKKKAYELGANKAEIKIPQLYDFSKLEHKVSTIPGYSRYQHDKHHRVKLKGNIRNRCLRIWRAMVITTDGNAVPCCFDKKAEHIMGNIEKDSIQSIWTGKEFKAFRGKVLTSRKAISICQNCSEGVDISPSL